MVVQINSQDYVLPVSLQAEPIYLKVEGLSIQYCLCDKMRQWLCQVIEPGQTININGIEIELSETTGEIILDSPLPTDTCLDEVLQGILPFQDVACHLLGKQKPAACSLVVRTIWNGETGLLKEQKLVRFVDNRSHRQSLGKNDLIILVPEQQVKCACVTYDYELGLAIELSKATFLERNLALVWHSYEAWQAV
jgi:hypothetical protein